MHVSVINCFLFFLKEIEMTWSEHINRHVLFEYSGCVAEYFKDGDDADDSTDKECQKKLRGYKCVLSSKATEDSMVRVRTYASNFL